MVFNPYGAGRKLYRSGDSAPTRGTVDPMGYVLRERLKQAQEPSQRRSGLAATALRRGGVESGGPVNTLSGNKNKKKGNKKRGKKPRPFVMVTPNGRLNLPWNMEHQLEAVAAKNKLDRHLQGLQTARQGYMQDYNSTLANSEYNYNQAQGQILDSDASRGMAFSSGHAQNVYDAGTEYNNFLQGMTADKTNFLADYRSQKQNARREFITHLANMAMEQGLDMSQFAGVLGYGRAGHKQPKGNKKPKNRRNRNRDRDRRRRRNRRR